MTVSVTMTFDNPGQMLEFFSRGCGVISPVDRPDAGALPPQPEPSPAQVFGAPSVAAAAPSLTVPAAPMVSSVPTPPAPAAPTVSAAPAPTAPAAPSGSAPGVELDADGLPWDGRIHASTKTKNADGTWRGKRGVDDAEVARVVAELKGLPAPVAPVPPAPYITAEAAALPASPVANLHVGGTVAPPPAPATPAGITFGELMVKLQGPMVSGTLPGPKLTEVLARYGCPQGVTQLMHVPHLVPAVDAELSAMLGMPAGALAQ